MDLNEKHYSVNESAETPRPHGVDSNMAVWLYLASLQRKREQENMRRFQEKEENPDVVDLDGGVHPVIRGWNLDAEKAKASRALRVASWTSIFFLITTDILGPMSCPWAFAQLGYVPGTLLFFFMGVAAAFTGWQLWRMYIQLDSDHFPIRTYSDLAGRIYGTWARHGVNILQTIQLLFNVAVIVLGNGQGLSQIAQAKVCFSVLVLVWALAGMIVGQIRSLKNFSWLANAAIWMNLLVIFITMGVVTDTAPNYIAAELQNGQNGTTVVTQAFGTTELNNKIVGVMQIVYSYGGAMLFLDFMAEMRRPFDFWKGMICAQVVIFACYLMFGVYVYTFQGQYTINPANQGISNYGWQTATNVISLVSALLAAGLYGNIGIKIVYHTIILDLFNGPAMSSFAGRVFWTFLVIVYWAIAFIVASAIPQINNISGMVAAVCILQFTYTFPPILMFSFEVQRDAITKEEQVDESSGMPGNSVDTWKNWSRWKRGLAPRWYVKIFNVILFLAALVTAALGIYSSGISIAEGFAQDGASTSFGCQSPVA